MKDDTSCAEFKLSARASNITVLNMVASVAYLRLFSKSNGLKIGKVFKSNT